MKFLQLVEENIEELVALDTLDVWGSRLRLGRLLSFHEHSTYLGRSKCFHIFVDVFSLLLKTYSLTHNLSIRYQLQGYTLHEPIGVIGQSELLLKSICSFYLCR